MKPIQYATFMSMVYLVALSSKDIRTKIGAVIVNQDLELLSTGYNGLPRGADDTIAERQEKPLKYSWFEHAERNAIYNATRKGVSLKDSIMFTQGLPCPDCARAIIQAGIKKVVLHKPWNDANSTNYDYTSTSEMFNECGVEIDIWDGYLMTPVGFRRGEMVSFGFRVASYLHGHDEVEDTTCPFKLYIK